MNQRWILLLAALACCSAVAWTFLGGRGGGRPAATRVEAAPSDLVPPRPGAPDLDAPTVAPAPPPAAARVAAGSAGSAAPDAAHPWRGRLAGLTGRLVEEDGAPVTGLRVELLQVESGLLLATDATALGNPSFELDEAVTGDDGRFVLEGGYTGAFHALGIDRGGARSTLRLVEQALELGQRVDLGDIVLPGYGTVFGTVVDEDGEPVAGARVRFAPVPEIVVDAGVLDLRADSLLAAQEGSRLMAFPLPQLVGDQLDKLPIATGWTAADGTFRIAGVPLGQVVGGADHPEHVAALVPAFEVQPGERDLGELELTFGRTVTGRVVDGAGQPLAGAEVRAGALHPVMPFGILQPAGVTDDAGRFALRGVSELGDVVAFARRTPRDEWIGAKAAGGADEVEVALAGAAGLAIGLSDSTGAPVSGATFRFTATPPDGSQAGPGAILALVGARAPEVPIGATETAPGRYAIDSLSFGSWLVEAEAPGGLGAEARVEHRAPNTFAAITCAPRQSLALRVVDAATGAPVAEAHAAVIGPRSFLFKAFASGWTDGAGQVTLGPFASLAAAFAAASDQRSEFANRALVRVQHPSYADGLVELAAGVEQMEVQLVPSCTLLGRIHWGGAKPARRYMVLLHADRDGMAQVFGLPRMTLSAADGTFRFTSLAPGEHRVFVAERYFEGDPLQLVVAQQEPTPRFEGAVTVRPGEPTQLDVDLSPTGLGPTGTLAGRVTVDGSPLRGARVEVRGEQHLTDGNGEFEIVGLSSIQGQQVTIHGEVELPDGTREERRLYQNWLRVEPNQVTRIDVEAAFAFVEVEVVDRDGGQALAGATVKLAHQWDAEPATTGADGRVRIVVDRGEHPVIEASLAGYATGRRSVPGRDDEEGKGEAVLRIELARSVRCAGTVVVSGGPHDWVYLNINSSNGTSEGTMLRADEGFQFSFDVAPGEYEAHLYVEGQEARETSFEVGPGGVEGLELRFDG